ncbi:MAG: UDP-N-acetylglucosamine 2-epimerase (non-hydrolyzing) [Bacteroidetes bacterium]|nr:UDP-N-acetylglucosamine 2-epimerase (non-hydrolyzing) [Bacteroidota bacterium]
MKKIISVVGARPNFVKIAPLHRAFEQYKNTISHKICHTGQHFDKKMSQVFFDELEMPVPDFYLGVGGGSHAVQTAQVMVEFEKTLLSEKPDLVIVPGDVNSTLAAALVAVKLHIPVAHVEAGLRSFDRRMPEEINRILADEIADLLFVTEQSGLQNLKNEGKSHDKIFFTGNIMIDSLVHYLPKIEQSTITKQLGIEKGNYVLATFHRPSNVDSDENLTQIITTLVKLAKEKQVIFPVHPRTKAHLDRLNLTDNLPPELILLEPIGYIDFLHLTKYASVVITDSGGIQEETTFLGVQCLTVRNSTERPITVDMGTNQLLGQDYDLVYSEAMNTLSGHIKTGKTPPLWDGKTAERIANEINHFLTPEA